MSQRSQRSGGASAYDFGPPEDEKKQIIENAYYIQFDKPWKKKYEDF
jgi:hypothetical protein